MGILPQEAKHQLLVQPGDEINNWNPLHEAARVVDENVVIESKKNVLFLAVEVQCHTVAEEILKIIDNKGWNQLLTNHQKLNILHLAPLCTAVLEKDSSVFSTEPLAWTKACEKGHVPALCAFIDHNPGAFRDLCIENKDSPLHHIKLSSLTDYEEFLKIPRMKDLINLQDSQGVIPLHKAIQDDNLFLTKTLLSIDKINYGIKDDRDNSAIDLLAQKSAENQAWDRMCKRIGLDPRIKTTYVRTKTTNLLDVRNSFFVVTALLATITLTAGFTLPGGFTQDTGEAILAKKAAFLVFLVSNTLALSFSMLVLICLIWSMVFDFSKSLTLIDRSMVFLRSALNFTLLTFMTGVYIVIAPKSLQAAILIIGIVSFLIGISINKDLLYNALECLDKFPSSSKKCIDRLRVMELGYKTQEELDILLSHHSEGNPEQSSRISSHSSDEDSDDESSNNEGSNDESSNEEASDVEVLDDEGSNEKLVSS
uniref:PGG domain-containing protein n=1 Tax=Chenopodium quinoa TaxID=63459 RepID=A0A803LYD6_CHEQI